MLSTEAGQSRFDRSTYDGHVPGRNGDDIPDPAVILGMHCRPEQSCDYALGPRPDPHAVTQFGAPAVRNILCSAFSGVDVTTSRFTGKSEYIFGQNWSVVEVDLVLVRHVDHSVVCRHQQSHVRAECSGELLDQSIDQHQLEDPRLGLGP